MLLGLAQCCERQKAGGRTGHAMRRTRKSLLALKNKPKLSTTFGHAPISYAPFIRPLVDWSFSKSVYWRRIWDLMPHRPILRPQMGVCLRRD